MAEVNKIRDFLRDSFAYFIIAGGVAVSGCGDFFKADFIKNTATQIMESEKSIFEKYKSETEVITKNYPPRQEEPYWNLNEEGKYTLHYKVAYANISELKTGIETLFKDDAVITTYPNLNKFVIEMKKESRRRDLEELLYTADRIPDHVQVKLDISGELGNITQDYSSELNLLYKSQGNPFGGIIGESKLPSSEPRVIARGSMINRWGLELGSDDFKLQAMLDVLKSHGFVKTLYQTEMQIPNGKKQMLGEEEKLLIDAYIMQGVQVVRTYNLVDVTSSVEITPITHDGLIELTFQATVGGSKRPNVRQRIMVPVKDTAQINGVYLEIGQPYSIAGRTKNMEIGIIRKDPFLPWPSGQDYENIITKIWYTVTPSKVIIYDSNSLVRSKYPIIKLNSKDVYDPNSLKKPSSELKTLEPKISPDKK